MAFNQGKTAALNMLGKDQPHDVVPYFFSDLADWASLEYVGPAAGWDQEVVRGSIDDGEFTIFYLDEGRVVAALTVGRSDDLEHAGRMLASRVGVQHRVHELGDLSSDLAAIQANLRPIRRQQPRIALGNGVMAARDALDVEVGVRVPVPQLHFHAG